MNLFFWMLKNAVHPKRSLGLPLMSHQAKGFAIWAWMVYYYGTILKLKRPFIDVLDLMSCL